MDVQEVGTRIQTIKIQEFYRVRIKVSIKIIGAWRQVHHSHSRVVAMAMVMAIVMETEMVAASPHKVTRLQEAAVILQEQSLSISLHALTRVLV